MNKILAGIGVSLLAMVALMGFLLRSSWEANAQTKQALDSLVEAQARQVVETSIMARRLEGLGVSVVELDRRQRVVQAGLDENLSALKNITKSEGDTDEQVQCLDLPVPSQLDQRLR